MRWGLVAAALALAGCAPAHHSAVPMSAQAQAAALDPGYTDRMGAVGGQWTASESGRATRAAQAMAICNARAEMSGAAYAGRGFGLAGAISAGVEAGIAAERVRGACMAAYDATGILPSF